MTIRAIVLKSGAKAVAADGHSVVLVDPSADPPIPLVFLREVAGGYEIITCEEPDKLRDAIERGLFPSQLKVTPATEVTRRTL